ncbi:MAG: hypothetical protein H6657_24925 [Ardenticatenaceae bacterium]|nr:hypothetical protein [Ardenticatenaceae bacterium]
MTQNEKTKWKQSRQVRERIFISGKLVLQSPTHLGNGDTSGVTDIGLLRDEVSGAPLLTGTSITGALRNYMREVELGYGVGEQAKGGHMVEKLFGYVGEDVADVGKQNPSIASIESWLMVDDALGDLPKTNPIEIRDGVALDADTRTAKDGAKYDIELLAAGTIFPLHFELWLTEENREMLPWLAIALQGLENEHIHLGMRKRRGYGRCKVTGWQVNRFAMNDVAQVVAWLNYQMPDAKKADGFQSNIASLLNVSLPDSDAREFFQMKVTFKLVSSLLIRADSGKADDPDMVHLKNAVGKSVLPGTSLAGSIRARAGRIARTLKGGDVGDELVKGMFGWHDEDDSDNASGSRVLVQESIVENPIANLVQNRVKLDRFTGGAYPGALFSQQPLFARTEAPTTVELKLLLRKLATMDDDWFRAEVGLLLLVLKDLWTGDLPLGGERSVGRGRLEGLSADLCLNGRSITISTTKDGTLSFPDGGAQELEGFVTALNSLEVSA